MSTDDTSITTATPDLAGLYASSAARVRRDVRRGIRGADPVLDDACQAAWARLVAARDRVNRDAAVAWLVTTAMHEAVRLLRREERDLSLEKLMEEWDDGPWTAAGPSVEDTVGARLRLQALRSLPERQRRLVWLQGLGLSYVEMARETAASRRTVERQILRARGRLRAEARGGQ
jgi:RNA polymerase sigma factor (sigma-70 family)